MENGEGEGLVPVFVSLTHSMLNEYILHTGLMLVL